MPDMQNAQSIMAFDFGTQKMGMAIGQSSIESSTPLPFFIRERSRIGGKERAESEEARESVFVTF